MSRVVVIVAIVAEIVTLTHFTNSDDPTWTNLIPSVLNHGGFGLAPTENMELSRSGYGFGYGDASQGGSMFGTGNRSGYGRGTRKGRSNENSNNSSSSVSNNGKGTFVGINSKGTSQNAPDGYTQKRSDRTPFGSRYGHNHVPVRGEQRIYGGDKDLERGVVGETDDSSTKTLTRDAKAIHQTREIDVRIEDQYGNPAMRRPSEATVEREFGATGRLSTGEVSSESGDFYGIGR
ncbi:MAG: hypothetical protein Q9160_004723 [Pyrenula sp. 1 TL-2023]